MTANPDIDSLAKVLPAMVEEAKRFMADYPDVPGLDDLVFQYVALADAFDARGRETERREQELETARSAFEAWRKDAQAALAEAHRMVEALAEAGNELLACRPHSISLDDRYGGYAIGCEHQPTLAMIDRLRRALAATKAAFDVP